MIRNPRNDQIEKSKQFEQRNKRNDETPHAPELELRKATNEGTEFIGATCREGWTIGDVVDLGIDLRREKSNEEVENVDS